MLLSLLFFDNPFVSSEDRRDRELSWVEVSVIHVTSLPLRSLSLLYSLFFPLAHWAESAGELFFRFAGSNVHFTDRDRFISSRGRDQFTSDGHTWWAAWMTRLDNHLENDCGKKEKRKPSEKRNSLHLSAVKGCLAFSNGLTKWMLAGGVGPAGTVAPLHHDCTLAV